jgi:hypothetical protein
LLELEAERFAKLGKMNKSEIGKAAAEKQWHGEEMGFS